MVTVTSLCHHSGMDPQAGLDGPSRTIIVEPQEQPRPERAPEPVPEPAPEPVPERAPERKPEREREPVPA